MYVVTSVAMVLWSFMVKVFLALWDNITCHGNAIKGGPATCMYFCHGLLSTCNFT